MLANRLLPMLGLLDDYQGGAFAYVPPVSPSDNGPYTIEQQRLFTPGTIEANVWPVGTDRQLVFTPGSFQINIVRP